MKEPKASLHQKSQAKTPRAPASSSRATGQVSGPAVNRMGQEALAGVGSQPVVPPLRRTRLPREILTDILQKDGWEPGPSPGTLIKAFGDTVFQTDSHLDVLDGTCAHLIAKFFNRKTESTIEKLQKLGLKDGWLEVNRFATDHDPEWQARGDLQEQIDGDDDLNDQVDDILSEDPATQFEVTIEDGVITIKPEPTTLDVPGPSSQAPADAAPIKLLSYTEGEFLFECVHEDSARDLQKAVGGFLLLHHETKGPQAPFVVCSLDRAIVFRSETQLKALGSRGWSELPVSK